MNGIIQAVKGLLSFLSAPLIGAMSDAWGRKSFLLLCVFFTCIPIPVLSFSAVGYFVAMAISGIFSATFSIAFAYVADSTCENERSFSYGVINYGRVPISLVQQTCQLSITSSLCSLTPTLAVPTGNDVSLFELFTGKKVAILKGHYGKVTSCILHPFEQELYSGGSDRNILCWTPPPHTTCESQVSRGGGRGYLIIIKGPSSSPPHPKTQDSSRIAAVYSDTWSDED
eukprot:Em0011g150a